MAICFSPYALATLLRPLVSLCTTLSCPSELFSRKYTRRAENLVNQCSIGFQGIEIIRILKLCQNIADLRPLKSLLVVHGLTKNEFLLGDFIKSCCKLGAPEMSLSIFQRIEKPSLSLQNLMVRCLSDHGLYQDVLCVYRKCRASGCVSDDFTFPFLIKACSFLGAFGTGKEIHCVVLRTGFDRNLFIQTALVDFYANNGHVRIAHTLIDQSPQPDLVSWNALIAGYSSNGLDREAFQVLRQIHTVGLKPNLSTFASIIPVCTRLGCLDIGKSVQGLAIKSGCLSNNFLVPALISMYASRMDLSSASHLFDSAPEKNDILGNSMIYAYAQNQKFYEAFEMFRQMLLADIRPNSVTFVSIVPSCGNYFDIQYGESLHAWVIKLGLENHPSVLTALLSMYGKLEDMPSAEFLFDQMPNRNLLSWNTMISSYVNNGLWDTGLAAVKELQSVGFTPDAITMISTLSACSKLDAVLLGKSAHAFCVRKGIDSNLSVSNALLGFYSDCCQLSNLLKLFHQMPNKNVVSWNTLISGYVNKGEMEKANTILYHMQHMGIKLDVVTLISILPTYSKGDNLEQGRALHGYAVKTGVASDISLSNALISMYCNCGDLDTGRSLLETMPQRSTVSWNALITGYRHYSLNNEVFTLFGHMIAEEQRPNDVTLLNLLPLCFIRLQGKSIHGFILRTGIQQVTPLVTSLIFMYARFENLSLCLTLFHLGNKKDVSLWNSIMSVHVQAKYAKRAVRFFCELLKAGLEPDGITVLTLISAGVELNSLNFADCVLAYVICKGLNKEIAISNALVDLYAKCGSISVAEKLFESLSDKDAVSWSVMINAYGLHGDGEAAIRLFSQLQLSEVRADEITYSSILSACSHAGLVEDAQMVFNSMLEQGMSPRMEHYSCLVDLLGRTGHLNEAYAIITRLPCKHSESLLRSFLGACRIYGNAELGEKVSRMVYKINPQDSESYVMLYNIYAAAGRWTDANRIRSEMESRGLRKLPGFSLLAER